MNIEQFEDKILDSWDWNRLFEENIAEYLGSDYAISCDSATNGFRTILDYYEIVGCDIEIPKQTYISIANQILLSKNNIIFKDIKWIGSYPIRVNYPASHDSYYFNIMDSACEFGKDIFNKYKELYNSGDAFFMIVSFHHRKPINIGKGGMILTNDLQFYRWARKYVYDGRDRNELYKNDKVNIVGAHYYMSPEMAKVGLSKLLDFIKEDNIRTTGSSLEYKELDKLEIFSEEKINTKIINKWNPKFFENDYFFKYFDNTFYKKYIILLPQENTIASTSIANPNNNFLELLDYKCEIYNKTVIIYTGSTHHSKYLIKKYKNISIIEWDSIDFFAKNCKFKLYQKSISDINDRSKFTTMINIKNGREWRIKVAELIYETQIERSSNLCIRTIELDNIDEYKFDNKHLKVLRNLNDTPFKSDSDLNIIGPVQNIFYEYYNAMIDIVVETDYQSFFITEKVLRPIHYTKPFLVYSCRKFHSHLEKRYNIKKFDNLFDYSFDDISDDLERLEMFFKELKRIETTYTNEEIFNLTNDVVLHNKEVLNSIIKNKLNHIPNEFYKIMFSND
jgi:hypothetical protein